MVVDQVKQIWMFLSETPRNSTLHSLESHLVGCSQAWIFSNPWKRLCHQNCIFFMTLDPRGKAHDQSTIKYKSLKLKIRKLRQQAKSRPSGELYQDSCSDILFPLQLVIQLKNSIQWTRELLKHKTGHCLDVKEPELQERYVLMMHTNSAGNHKDLRSPLPEPEKREARQQEDIERATLVESN